MNKIGVVLVTYNSADFVGRCLRSLENVESVIVVDNASTDRTAEIVAEAAPKALLLRNDENRGFAAAVNQGVRALDSEVVVLINPDAELLTPLTTENPLVRRALEEGVGVVGGKLVDEAGAYQEGFAVRRFPTPATLSFEALLLNRLWPSNPVNRRYRMPDFDAERAQPVDQPAGALLAFRRDVHRRLGGFDERFHPLWFEDVDFCSAAAQAGLKNFYEPGCVARHRGAHSIASIGVRQRQAAWYGSLLRFAEKRFSSAGALSTKAAVALGLGARGLGCFLGAGKKTEGLAYFQTIRSAFNNAGAPTPRQGARLEGGPAA